MTKLKNTKKGMAKKALSISLVAAMLATSNVPVWAAEDLFSDGSAAVEAPVVEEPAQAVEEVTDVAPLSSVVTENDLTVNLTVSSKTVVWGNTAVISGTITNKEDGSNFDLSKLNYRWLDESGISMQNGSVNQISDMSLQSKDTMAGKTLTLYIYSDKAGETDFDINTGIKVTVEKRTITGAAITEPGLNYNGFSQSVSESNVTSVTAKINDISNETISDKKVISDSFTITSTSAVNAKEKVTVTVTAKADSPYTGSYSKSFEIGQKTYDAGKEDIVAKVESGLSYQYTGFAIEIPTDKVSIKESQSTNNGKDGKLNGNDLSSAITKAETTETIAGTSPVKISIDNSKLKNFANGPASLTTTEKVTIAKRDLSTSGTKITVKNGKIKTGTKVNQLKDCLEFKGTEGTKLNLNNSNEYTISVKDPSGNDVTDKLSQTGTYTVTVTAKTTATNVTGSQTFTVQTVGNVLQSATVSEIEDKNYKPEYTGSEIRPTQDDLGTLTVDGTAGKETLQASEWKITGYTNNTNAATYDGAVGGTIKTQAYVNIEILDGMYRGETYALPFVISPLEVKEQYVTVPTTINYNEDYAEAKEYNVPVTVVAKDTTGKTVKTLSADDYTIKYEFEDGDKDTPVNTTPQNELHDKIKTTVTIKNTNYILGSTDGKTKEVPAKEMTEIVAKALTDSMVKVNPSTYTYTGGTITPSYVVMDGQLVLYKEGDVATGAEYKEVGITDAVNVGTGKITVEGLDPYYSGTATGTFTITAANTQDVKIEISNQAYTGRQIRPRDFKATLNGNDVTNQFEIVSYGDNIEAGKGTVVIGLKSGNKNFVGNNITAEFNIVKEEVSGTLKIYNDKGVEVSGTPSFKFDGNEKTFSKVVLTDLVKVGGGKTTATAEDFEIKYVDNICGKDNNGSGDNVAYVYAVAKEGTGFAGAETSTITTADGTVIKGVVAMREFKIETVKFVEQNITVKNGSYAGGLPVKPEILIQIGGSTLVEGKDYTVKVSGGDTYVDVTNGKIYDVEITGINGYTASKTIKLKDSWGIDKKDFADCNITVTNGVVSVMNGYIPVPTTEYTSKDNGDGTYTVTANSESKNYTGSKTVTAEGQAEDEAPAAPVIQSVNVNGNNATVVLAGESDGATGYDYVISTDRDCITTKDYNKVNKNILTTNTTFTYTQQGVYYAYCHAWKRVDGEKVFSEWSNAYPFVVSSITPEQPSITKVEKSSNGKHLRITWTKSANAIGYDVVMGTKLQKVNGEYRPVEYGKAVKKVTNGNTVSVIFYNVPKGTYYVGLHAYNRSSESGVKVFSQWSNSKKVTF